MKQQPYRIFAARAEDAERVKRFVIPTMTALYPPGAFNANPDDLRRFSEVYVQPSNACFFMAVDEENHLVGTAAARPYDGRFAFLKDELDKQYTCEITKVYIRDTLRRQGIGAALYDAIENYIRAEGYESAYLHTSTYLPGGYPFWQSRGYRELYEEDGSIVHMKKALKQ